MAKAMSGPPARQNWFLIWLGTYLVILGITILIPKQSYWSQILYGTNCALTGIYAGKWIWS